MPITKSAIKQMKQANAAKKHNRDIKTNYKNKVKAVQKDLLAGGSHVATLASDAFAALDKAAKTNVIHKRTAARRKARLMALVNKTTKKPVELKSTKVKTAVAKPKITKTAKPTAKKPAVKKATTATNTTKKTTKKASK
jgi:small subunit ribosomal protein S20